MIKILEKLQIMMSPLKGKRFSAAVALLLVLTIAISVLPALPLAEAKTTISLSMIYEPPHVGINSPTLFNWRATPNVLLTSPAYSTQTLVWPNATVTFTKPDGTTDIIHGPFNSTFPVPGDNTMRDIILLYTPTAKGEWTVNFTWPGDDTYDAVTQIDTFTVGDHVSKRDVFAYLALRPYPAVGIGQELLVNAWITPAPMTSRSIYRDYTFTITKPDGQIAYTFTIDSEAPGTVWWSYAFDQLGNWTIKFDFPGDHFSKAATVTQSIIVQQDPIPYPIEDTPLPTEAWTFPVNVFNREWRNIAGPWYMNGYNSSKGSWNPYTEAPMSAHILWKAEPAGGVGGYIGATAASSGITTSSIYSSTPIRINTIMAGRGYYTSGGKIYCINMSTGQTLWNVNGSFNIGATRSRLPVLYEFTSTRFRVYDALTGAITLDVPGMSMANEMYDDPYVFSQSGDRIIKWTTAGTTSNFTERIIWNVSTPLAAMANANTLLQNGILFQVSGPGQGASSPTYLARAINATTGETLYNHTLYNPSDPYWIYNQGPTSASGYGLYYRSSTPLVNEGRGYIAYNVTTGYLEWTSEQTSYPWGNFWAYSPQACGYGMIFGLNYDGIYAFNVTNGKIVWHYSAGDSGMETPYNTWPFGSVGPVVGGGLVFAPSTEHTPSLYYRGTKLHAVDALTGEQVWTILGYYTPTAIAYGTLLAIENPSGYTYAFAKGQTATTVTTQNDVYTKGNTILIKGTVMDLSPAQPNTPAVSDDSMSAWMEYLHMQQPKPTNTTGVPVKLTAVDATGNPIDLGVTTTDADGTFAIMWTPQTEGKYKIVASFAGSNSYYGSDASTVVGVSPSAVSSPSVTNPPTSPSVTSSPAPSTTTSASPTDSTIPTSTPSAAIPDSESTTGTEIYIAIAAAVIITAVIAVALVLRRRSK